MAASGPNNAEQNEYREHVYKMKGSTTIYADTIVVAGADGYAKPGTAATSLRYLGVADETVTNAGADGAKSIRVKSPFGPNGLPLTFKFNNDATTALTQADVGAAPALKDDLTFSGDDTGRTAMGKVVAVMTDGIIWAPPFP